MHNLLTSFDFFSQLSIGVTKLDGPDGRQFLQGQLTCELDALTPSHSQLAAHCDAKGKMMATLRLIDNEQEILALQPLSNTPEHLPMLAKYAVFSKVTITDASEEFIVSGLAGEQALIWLYNELSISLNNTNDAANTDIGTIILVDDHRVLIVAKKSEHQRLLTRIESQSFTTQNNEIWQALECLAGMPQVTPQTQGEFVPQMQNMQMIDAISFKKGCYIGQETVARMHFRGLNKRGMFVLQAPSHIECKVGDNVEKQLGENWRNTGTLVNIAHVANQTIACAVLPIDVDLAMPLRVKDNDDGQFIVSKPAYFVDKAKT